MAQRPPAHVPALRQRAPRLEDRGAASPPSRPRRLQGRDDARSGAPARRRPPTACQARLKFGRRAPRAAVPVTSRPVASTPRHGQRVRSARRRTRDRRQWRSVGRPADQASSRSSRPATSRWCAPRTPRSGSPTCTDRDRRVCQNEKSQLRRLSGRRILRARLLAAAPRGRQRNRSHGTGAPSAHDGRPLQAGADCNFPGGRIADHRRLGVLQPGRQVLTATWTPSYWTARCGRR